MFQNAAAGLFEKLPKLAKIIFAPDAAETRRIAEPRAAGLAGLRIDDIVRRVNRTAGEQRIAAERDSFAAGVIGERFHLRQIFRRFIFDVETAAERHDDHFKSDGGALVNGRFHRVRRWRW